MYNVKLEKNGTNTAVAEINPFEAEFTYKNNNNTFRFVIDQRRDNSSCFYFPGEDIIDYETDDAWNVYTSLIPVNAEPGNASIRYRMTEKRFEVGAEKDGNKVKYNFKLK